MSIELKIPAVGESITEVRIGEWLKSEGDVVKQDEPLAVIDSEKTTFELPAPQNGRLAKILRQAGETVTVGTVVAEFDTADDAAPQQANTPPQKVATPKPEDVKPQTPVSSEKSGTKQPVESEKKSPEAKEAKKETPPAPATEIKEPATKPAPATARAKPSSARDEVVPMTMLRRTAAQRLVEAQQTMAMLTTFNEVDMSAVLALRKEYQERFEKRHQVKLGLMSFFIKAATDALKQFPQLNAEVKGTDIVYHHSFDIGVAVATERGLVVPVLRDVEHMTFAEVEHSIGDFAKRAKEGRLKPEELASGTFTITNGGVFGSLLSTPIINPPQAGILGLHSIQDRPVAIQGQVAIRPMMYIALTYDHRIVDGREAILFLLRVKETIENPARMLLNV